MARPRKNVDPNAVAATEEAKAQRVVIRAKDKDAWGKLLKTASDTAWRTLRIEIQIRDRLMAGKPANLDAAKAMLKANGLEDEFVVQAEDIIDPTERKEAAERIAKYEGLCEFARREGHPGIWMPSNNIKAGLKENWSVLGLRNSVRGSRGALAEGIFVNGLGGGVEGDWIYLGEQPSGVATGVAHTTGAMGPISSIKRNEFVTRPRIVFELIIANAKSVSEKISDDELAATLTHFGEHGLGANRSQGFGRFDVLSVEEIERS